MLNYTKVLLFFCMCSSIRSVDVQRPNIVMFLTDDQDSVLDGMSPMRNVKQFIANHGVTFSNAFVASPICCPSRASILTGQYPHNHHTYNNSINGGCNGNKWKTLEQNTFANILQKEGYNTFYAGKYLNQYGVKEAGGPEIVPPGWTEWHGLVGNSVYYDYVISNNGVPTRSTDLYLTDIIRNLGVNYIENQTEAQPFLMILAPPAPHQPFTPAPRHKGVFANTTVKQHPNFNIVAENKHWLMRMTPSPLPKDSIPELDRVYSSRWESLLAVDELVADVINVLEIRGFLDNTYLIYTSDNGYHIGQFSQMYDKRQPYETDIRVPLFIKGPHIQYATNDDPVMNIDLAPTILSLAGLNPPKHMDGQIMNLFTETESQERNMLIEYYGEHNVHSIDSMCPWKYDGNLAECKREYQCKCQDTKNNTYACIRSLAPRINFKYCKFSDDENFIEVYDLIKDPFELYNIADDILPAVKYWYQMTLTRLLVCQGATSCSNNTPQE